MNTSPSFSSNQSRAIQLEVASDDEQQADLADIDEIGQELVNELRKNQYTVSPTYTGKKGVPVFDVVLQIPLFIHANKELLTALFESLSLTLQCLLIVRNQRVEKEKERRVPLEFTLELDGNPITITAHNTKSAVELLKSFQETHPEATKKLTPASSVKVKAKVSKKRRRHSH
jgi:hypothetical protein